MHGFLSIRRQSVVCSASCLSEQKPCAGDAWTSSRALLDSINHDNARACYWLVRSSSPFLCINTTSAVFSHLQNTSAALKTIRNLPVYIWIFDFFYYSTPIAQMCSFDGCCSPPIFTEAATFEASVWTRMQNKKTQYLLSSLQSRNYQSRT